MRTNWLSVSVVLLGLLISWGASAQAPAIVSPTPSSALDVSNPTFTWDPGTGADAYWLYVGTTAGNLDVFNSGQLTSSILSIQVSGLPTDKSTVYVTFFYLSGGQWYEADYTYAACDTCASTAIGVTEPVGGSTLAVSAVLFKWDSGADNYWLDFGTSPGASDFYSSGSLGTVTQKNIVGLPIDGSMIYLRFWYFRMGVWNYRDYSYETCTGCASTVNEVTSPIPGSKMSSSTVTFSWRGVADEYWFYVGTSAGALDIYNSGTLGTSHSQDAAGLPTDGSTFYLTFFYKIDGVWYTKYYTYVSCTGCSSTLITLLSPADTATLTDSTALFSWSPGADNYWLDIGTTPGATDIYTSGSLGPVVSKLVSGLPSTGSTIYLRFWYFRGVWNSRDYYFTAWDGCPYGITAPTNGSTLVDSYYTFTWNGCATDYWLYVGTVAGAVDIYNSGLLSGSTKSWLIEGLPNDGTQFWVRLFYKVGGFWNQSDYSYTACSGCTSTAIEVTDPINYATLSGTSVDFTWDSGGTNYWLDIGHSLGTSDIYSSGSLGPVTSQQVDGLPNDGSQVFLRFWYVRGGVWNFHDYQYTAFFIDR